MLGHFRLLPPSWTDSHNWPPCDAVIDPMPDKMNLDFLKLLYDCEFQKYEVMTKSVVVVRYKRNPANPSYRATTKIERSFLISNYY